MSVFHEGELLKASRRYAPAAPTSPDPADPEITFRVLTLYIVTDCWLRKAISDLRFGVHTKGGLEICG
jgi:hypothetical protein